MKILFSAAIAALALSLAACGGGGTSGGSGAATTPPTISPTTQPTSTPSSTLATGMLVDDATGSPIAGARVILMPWGPCAATPAPGSITPESDGCPTPLPSPQATTNAQGQFTLGAPNGQYVLVIGADAVATPPAGYSIPSGTPTPAPFVTQATIHDNVTFTGGMQTLRAPTLQAEPTVTPPAWETNGDYRLAKLDATTEMPCYLVWQYARAQKGLPLTSVDEWATENVRAINAARRGGGIAYLPVSIQGAHPLTSEFGANGGGSTCADLVLSSTMTFPFATDPRVLWFAGQYLPYTGGNASALGLTESPIDPRSYVDPNVPVWP